jgi:hypothetical protein
MESESESERTSSSWDTLYTLSVAKAGITRAIIIRLKGLTTESLCNAQTSKKPRVNLKKEIGVRGRQTRRNSPQKFSRCKPTVLSDHAPNVL